MCVRYTLHTPQAALEALEGVLSAALCGSAPLEPRYNIAPSQLAPVVAKQSGAPLLGSMRFGLLPPGDRGAQRQRALPNARAETIGRLPAFRAAAAGRRCLVPACGFYEFRDLGARKQPWLFTLGEDAPMALAGLWEPPDGAGPPTFCIVTTGANRIVGEVHDRMPVILAGESAALWLGDTPLGSEELARLTLPAADGLLRARRVDPYVNNSRHEGPRCVAPPPPEDPELF